MQVFPKLEFCSFVILLTFVNIALFTSCLCVGGIENTQFLGVPTATLIQFGAKVPELMRYEMQLWRFITPVFLHGSFSHIMGNSITLLLLGQLVEHDMGSWLFLFFYLLTGFGGILFSALCSDAVSVGASTALFGIIGSYAANLILNWTHFKENPNKRCNILIFLLVSVFLAVGSTADPRVD